MKSIVWTIAAAVAAAGILATSVPAGAQPHRAASWPYRLTDLGTFGGRSAYLDGSQQGQLNSHGVVAGTAETATPDAHPKSCAFSECLVSHAFLGTAAGLKDLGAIPGTNTSDANSINDEGITVGGSQNGKVDPITGQPEWLGAVWVHNRMRLLRTLGGTQSAGMTANARGDIVGWALNKVRYRTSLWGDLGTEQRAVLWSGNKVKDLGSLGGPSSWA